MNIYMLIPFMVGDNIEVKEQNGFILKGNMVREYAKRFGEKNKYYIDRSSDIVWEISEMKDLHYNDSIKSYYYDVFRPGDITRR